MTERRVSEKRIKSSHPRMGVQSGRAASTRRQLWVAMLATAGAAVAGIERVEGRRMSPGDSVTWGTVGD